MSNQKQLLQEATRARFEKAQLAALEVRCPKCGAPGDSGCFDRQGRERKPHAARVHHVIG